MATASYEARKFGVHSAMPSSVAYRKCPQAIFVLPHFDVYTSVSQQIRDIFHEYTDLVEPLSLDEAYLDVTHNKKNIPWASTIAKEIKEKIYKTTGLTASAGVSYNKFIAKVASDFKKPNGMTVIPPEKAQQFIEKLPIRKFYGVGAVTEKKMHELKIFTGADLKKWTREQLRPHFGKMADYFYDIARGIDESPVISNWVRQSYGREETFEKDIGDVQEMKNVLSRLANDITEYLKKEQKKGKTVQIKVRYQNFETLTRQKSLPEATDDKDMIVRTAEILLDKTDAGKRKVRLLGLSITKLT